MTHAQHYNSFWCIISSSFSSFFFLVYHRMGSNYKRIWKKKTIKIRILNIFFNLRMKSKIIKKYNKKSMTKK